jgi:hypothetical protein
MHGDGDGCDDPYACCDVCCAHTASLRLAFCALFVQRVARRLQSSDDFAGFADAHGRLTLGTIVMWCDELLEESGDCLVAPTKALWASSLQGCKELVSSRLLELCYKFVLRNARARDMVCTCVRACVGVVRRSVCEFWTAPHHDLPVLRGAQCECGGVELCYRIIESYLEPTDSSQGTQGTSGRREPDESTIKSSPRGASTITTATTKHVECVFFAITAITTKRVECVMKIFQESIHKSTVSSYLVRL